MTYNPYNILEINNTATEQEIKKAYRKLSIKYHPDRIKDDDPDRDQKIAKFTQLTESKDLLLDSDLRHAYNRGGWDMVNHVKNTKREMHQRKMKCETLTVEKTVTLKQLYHNESVKLEVPVSVYKDNGDRTMEKFPMEFKLEGLGKVVAENVGIQRPDRTPGDIIVITKLPDDCPFKIKQLDLIYDAKLGLRDLITGYSIVIPHPTGNCVLNGKYTFANGDDDNLFIFPGMGMKHGHMRGDLIVHCLVDLSELKRLNDNQKKTILDVLTPGSESPSDARNITDIAKTPSQMSAQRQSLPGELLGMTGPGCPIQ